MTESQTTSTAPVDGRGTKALRVTTHALRLLGDHVGAVVAWGATLAGVGYIVNDVTGIVPFTISGTGLVILILAAWGAAQLIRSFAYTTADRIDPDYTDGDVLWSVARQFAELTMDVHQGADLEDILIDLRASNTLPALSKLLGTVGDAYDEDGDREDAAAFYDAAISVREAAHHVGVKNQQNV